MNLVVVLCTFPSIDVAKQVATTLIERRLAACVNLSPGLHSIYRWEGKVESAEEVLGLIKTARERYAALESALKELHPYDVPEIVMLPAEAVHPLYGRFVQEAVA